MKIISQRAAKALGLRKYFTGKACPNGHVSERYVCSHTCTKCHKATPKGVKTHQHFFCAIYKAAKSCETRKQFRDGHRRMYEAAGKRGLIAAMCSHMPPSKTSGVWDAERLLNTAKDFEMSSAFATAFPGAVDAALRLGIWKEITSHMEAKQSDFDAIYMWGKSHEDGYLCKFGVTSQRLGLSRIEHVSKRSGIDVEFIILAASDRALVAEAVLKKIGIRADVSGFNGASEFRIVSNSNLTQAYGVIYEHANSAA